MLSQGLSDSSVDRKNEMVSLANGTSYSAPIVSGIAAVLRRAFPAATARQIRRAITEEASPGVTGDGSGSFDQGEGWVDALAAFERLRDNMPSDLPDVSPVSDPLVSVNLENATGLDVYSGSVTLFGDDEIAFLLPGDFDNVKGTHQTGL